MLDRFRQADRKDPHCSLKQSDISQRCVFFVAAMSSSPKFAGENTGATAWLATALLSLWLIRVRQPARWVVEYETRPAFKGIDLSTR